MGGGGEGGEGGVGRGGEAGGHLEEEPACALSGQDHGKMRTREAVENLQNFGGISRKGRRVRGRREGYPAVLACGGDKRRPSTRRV